jgi:starch synthase (maltosyl-transferring)
MRFVDNDRWAGGFPLTGNTRYLYTVEAWRDLFASWRVEVTKKHDANVPIALELIEGRRLVERTAAGADGPDAEALEALLGRLDERGADDQGWQLAVMLGEDLRALMQRCDLRANRSRYGRSWRSWSTAPPPPSPPGTRSSRGR